MADPLYSEALSEFAAVFRLAHPDPRDPIPAALATVSPDGAPAVRTILLKSFDEAGFVFFTNMESRKAAHLRANRRAALVFHWMALERQLIVEGTAETVSDEEADAYWQTRPRESQIGAWASLQSRVLDDRGTLEHRYAEFAKRYSAGPVPRPAVWSGFRIVPHRLEVWQGRPHRLHDRLVYEKGSVGWTKGRLYP